MEPRVPASCTGSWPGLSQLPRGCLEAEHALSCAGWGATVTLPACQPAEQKLQQGRQHHAQKCSWRRKEQQQQQQQCWQCIWQGRERERDWLMQAPHVTM